jgi:rRNA maturation protein Nop10
MTLYCTVCGGDRVHPVGPGFDDRYPWGRCRDCDRKVVATTTQDAASRIIADRQRARLERNAARRAAR